MKYLPLVLASISVLFLFLLFALEGKLAEERPVIRAFLVFVVIFVITKLSVRDKPK